MLKAKPAYSLIFALVIMSMIMIVASNANTSTRSGIKNTVEVTLGNVYSKYASETAMEDGIMAIKDCESTFGYKGCEAGFEPADYTGTAPDGVSEMTYSVLSRAQENSASTSGYFYTPIPGSGTAAPSEDCDVMASSDEDVDQACNWNKLLYGDSVTIPLYAYDRSAGLLKNPNDLGLTEWNLKVRTPCEADSTGVMSFAEDCDTGLSGDGRYSLDGNSSDYENDDSIVLWQLIGVTVDDATGEETTVFSVVPDDKHAVNSTTRREQRASDSNSEIYESLINTAASSIVSPYTVLSTDSPVNKTVGSITYTNLLDLCNDSTIEKLYLQLDIVNPLKTSTKSVPFLEWQLESKTNGGAFADNKAIIIAHGLYEGSLGTYDYPSVVYRTTVGQRNSVYTISN